MIDVPLEERTVTAAMRRAVDKNPDGVFLRHGAGSLTYAEFDTHSNRVANGLAELGLQKDDKVALFLRNSVEFVSAWFGAAKLGAIYVPINTEYKGDILVYQLNKADVTHIVADADLAEEIARVKSELNKITTVIIRRVGDNDARTPSLRDAFNVVDFAQLLDAPDDALETDIHYNEPHAISFTSGTTGPSKGVLATQCHVVSFALDWIEACGARDDDRIYTCLPMFHAIAAWLGVLPAVLLGTEVSFSERFSARAFWDDVRRFDATIVHGIFSMVPILLKQPPRDDDADVPARVFYIGQRNEEFERRFNCRIVEVYGATETGIVTYTPIGDEPAQGSCGKANASTYHVALVDENDNEVPPGEIGEIVVRPNQPYSMIREYYNMERETLDAFRNMWFHTGDNARRDENGFFFFVDRKKDAMRRRGENISSFELERVLNGDERVLECAAIAAPSELGEDEVKMVVVPQTGVDLSDEAFAREMWRVCEERMPRFWVPRFLEVRRSLPKTPNGKVRKFLLRDGVDAGAEFDREAIST